MRTFMDAIRVLFEHPVLVGTSATVGFDNGMENARINRSTAKAMLEDPDNLEETKDFWLYRFGSDQGGHIALIDKTDREIKYLVQYDRQSFPGVGTGIVQIALWRLDDYAPNLGITRRVFFDHLLPMFGTVVCDETQTHAARSFWIRVMAQAHAAGLKVGFLDMRTGESLRFPGSPSLGRWASEIIAGWGEGEEFGAKRFFVST